MEKERHMGGGVNDSNYYAHPHWSQRQQRRRPIWIRGYPSCLGVKMMWRLLLLYTPSSSVPSLPGVISFSFSTGDDTNKYMSALGAAR